MPQPLICYILIGLPGSGKSTLAQSIVEYDSRYHIISTDQIRAALYGDASIQGTWSEIETVVLSQIQQTLSENYPIIYDATNYKQSDRRTLMQKLTHYSNIHWVALYLTTSIEQCKQWNQCRDRQVDEAVIDTMAQRLLQHPPKQKEGFARVEQILPATICDIAPIIQQINDLIFLANQQVQIPHAP